MELEVEASEAHMIDYVKIQESRWLCLSAHCAVLCHSEAGKTWSKSLVTHKMRNWT